MRKILMIVLCLGGCSSSSTPADAGSGDDVVNRPTCVELAPLVESFAAASCGCTPGTLTGCDDSTRAPIHDALLMGDCGITAWTVCE